MSETLQNLSSASAEVVERAGASVVRIEGRRRIPASGIVWSAEGVILTAHHALKRDDNLIVGTADRQTHTATLVGRDPATDLAVLRISSTNLQPLAPQNLERVRVGQLALALARPGRTVQASLGIIGALGEKWRTPLGGLLEAYLRTEITLYPGFSGGPLLDATGQLLGLNTSALLRNLSVAVPVPTLNRVTDELLAHGRIRRGYLGIGAQPAALPPALQQQLQQDTGLLVVSVAPGSPAEKHGLLLGDAMVAAENHPIEQFDDLLSYLSSDRIGQEITVRLVRSGQVQEVKMTVGEHL